MDNVISFPLHRRRESILYQELEKALADDQEEYDMTLEHTDEILGMIISEMVELGYPLADEEYICEVSFMWEAIKSCLMRALGKDHPLHDVAEKLYSQYIREEDDPIQMEFEF